MSKLTKNAKLALSKIEAGKAYSLAEAAEKVKEITYTKFDASLDIDVRLGVDPRKANQMVRGVVTLPHGTGKTVKVLVLCNPDAEAAAKAAEAAVVTPQKEECTFDDFGKMDIRTATVLEAERVPKTDKLLKLTIDTGIDKRVIVSGIAEQYSPEEMVVKQICILANLAPRKIRGIESKGMILMARQNDGKMRFITPQETLCNGAEIG